MNFNVFRLFTCDSWCCTGWGWRWQRCSNRLQRRGTGTRWWSGSDERRCRRWRKAAGSGKAPSTRRTLWPPQLWTSDTDQPGVKEIVSQEGYSTGLISDARQEKCEASFWEEHRSYRHRSRFKLCVCRMSEATGQYYAVAGYMCTNGHEFGWLDKYLRNKGMLAVYLLNISWKECRINVSILKILSFKIRLTIFLRKTFDFTYNKGKENADSITNVMVTCRVEGKNLRGFSLKYCMYHWCQNHSIFLSRMSARGWKVWHVGNASPSGWYQTGAAISNEETAYVGVLPSILMMFFLDCAWRASPCTLPLTPLRVPGLPGLWLCVDLDIIKLSQYCWVEMKSNFWGNFLPRKIVSIAFLLLSEFFFLYYIG